MTASKNSLSNVFRSCFWRTSLLYPTKLFCTLHFNTVRNSCLITVGVLQTPGLGPEHIYEKKTVLIQVSIAFLCRRLHSKEFSIHTY